MLILENISLISENIRLIFFDFGLKSENKGITMSEMVIYPFLVYIHTRAYMRVYIVAISKKEATLPTLVTPKSFLFVWSISEVRGHEGRKGHFFSQYYNYRDFLRNVTLCYIFTI